MASMTTFGSGAMLSRSSWLCAMGATTFGSHISGSTTFGSCAMLSRLMRFAQSQSFAQSKRHACKRHVRRHPTLQHAADVCFNDEMKHIQTRTPSLQAIAYSYVSVEMQNL